MPRKQGLPAEFPFRAVFNAFLVRYRAANSTLWYLPKYTLTGESVANIQQTLKMLLDEFEGRAWNRDLQDEIRQRLIAGGLAQPYTTGRGLQDRTAIVRVGIRKFFEYLGLAWILDERFHVTDVGLEVATEENVRPILEAQIAKFQYPNPVTGIVGPTTDGIIPHLFLLQCLVKCDGWVSVEEFNLFINLAGSQDDLDEIVRYINAWRNLSSEERDLLEELVRNTQRFNQIRGLTSYQRAFFCYPSYVQSGADEIRLVDAEAAKRAINKKTKALKITTYKEQADWFEYYGDPERSPSWFEYISASLQAAETGETAKEIVKEALTDPVVSRTLTAEQVEVIKRKEVEKDIEEFYVKHLDQLEPGLKLVKGGRQFITGIGRMDLLCKDAEGQYVVVEVKAGEAEDGVFGQILRYIGWVHSHLNGGRNNVRGIILAGNFPTKARYSHMGLLKDDYQTFIKFKKHGLAVQDS